MKIRDLKSLRSPSAAALLAMVSLAAAADPQPGMRVARDPETGQLRAPTSEELKALSGTTAEGARAALPRGLITGRVRPPQIVHPDGTIEQELDDSTLMYSVARRGADGKIEMYCVPGKAAAEQLVKSKKVATRSAKEHTHAQ